MPRNKKKLNVFICTAREDLLVAKGIRFFLGENLWIKPWLYKEDMVAGQEYDRTISVEMNQADVIIVCISKKSIARQGYFQKEIRYALEKLQPQLPEGGILILPLIVDECEPPHGLKNIRALEYSDAEQTHKELLHTLEFKAKSTGVRITKSRPFANSHEQVVPTDLLLSRDTYSDEYDSMPRKLGELVLDEDLYYFDSHHRNVTRFVLAKLLELDERYVVIADVKEGSVKVLIELPDKAFTRLDSLVKNRDKELYRLFKVKSFSLADELDFQPKLDIYKLEKKKLEFSLSFVGQEDEINVFRHLLQNPNGEKRIALILGSGGIGKTFLVKALLREARVKGLLAPEEPIDLFSTDYHHIDWIQWKIIEIVENLSGLKNEQSPFASYVKGRTDTSDNFYDCLKEFCAAHPLVLAFDTFENLDRVASNWLFKSERGGLQVPGLICIIAGREDGREKEELDGYRKNLLVKDIPISGFTLEEAEEFYRRIGNEFSGHLDDDLRKALGMEPSDPIHEGIEQIWEIAGGYPLKLEMAFRWSGSLLSANSLVELTSDQYEEKLMQHVREWGQQGELVVNSLRVQQPVFETLTCMAYVVRRFDVQFLQFLIGEKFIHFGDSDVSKEEVLDYLRQYFFVKTRGVGDGGLEIVQLHDEMARLVREHVWPSLDLSGDKRREIYRAVIRFYDALIEQALPELVETLQIEQLYYILQLDQEGVGIQRWFELAELGNENINNLLPGEIKEYIKNYEIETQVRIHSRIAEMENNARHTGQALGHWDEVRKLGEMGKRYDWVVESLRGKFNCVWMEDSEGALNDYLMPALRICERRIPGKLAQIYYEIGFAYRQMQELMQAAEWYEKGLRQFKKYPDDLSLEATLYNDAGYAYLQMGRWGDSFKYLNEALDLRLAQFHLDDEKLKAAGAVATPKLHAAHSQSAMFAGLSYNTLGEYHRYVDDLDEALKQYNEAYKLFVDVGDYFWQAKCLCARGETYRRLGQKTWSEEGKESSYQEYFEQAREDMEQSLYLCEKYNLHDERDTANRRLGRLAHDEEMIALGKKQSELARKKLKEARTYFQVGLDFAQKTNDVVEELENLTELAFLADDAIVVYGKDVPAHYHGEVDALKKALETHEKDPQRIYWYPVFVALLKMEQAAIAFARGEYDTALAGYVEAFKGLGTFPGYGHSRYKQHFDHLTSQVMQLPRDEQLKWRDRFVSVWMQTPMPGREGQTLTDDLLPDLVKWFNRLIAG